MENKIKFISTDTLSVDFFRGIRKIAVFTDNDYGELKSIVGEYGVKVYRVDDKIVNTDSSLIVGIGGDKALRRAKQVAIIKNTECMLIPAVPTEEATIGFLIDDNCKIRYLTETTVVAVNSLLNNQPRENLSRGIESISGVLINLIDQAVCSFLQGENRSGEKLLELVKTTLSNSNKYASPYPTLGSDLMKDVYELTSELSSDNCNSFVATKLFLADKRKNEAEQNCLFQVAFSIFAVYNSYRPNAELILPPDRQKYILKLKELCPNAEIPPLYDDFMYARFVLSDRYDQIIDAIQGFVGLAKTYFRLSGYSAYERRKEFSAVDFLNILPQTAELDSNNSLLKHIYASGYLK